MRKTIATERPEDELTPAQATAALQTMTIPHSLRGDIQVRDVTVEDDFTVIDLTVRRGAVSRIRLKLRRPAAAALWARLARVMG